MGPSPRCPGCAVPEALAESGRGGAESGCGRGGGVARRGRLRRGLELLRRRELDAVPGIVEAVHPDVRVEVVRREPVLVATTADHPLAAHDEVPLARLADVELLLPSQEAAAEWVDFVHALCGAAGFEPRRWPGVIHGSISAAEVLRERGCVTPTAAWVEPLDGLVFRPLVDPAPILPWSLAWRADDRRDEIARPRCMRARPPTSGAGASSDRPRACGCRAPGPDR